MNVVQRVHEEMRIDLVFEIGNLILQVLFFQLFQLAAVGKGAHRVFDAEIKRENEEHDSGGDDVTTEQTEGRTAKGGTPVLLAGSSRSSVVVMGMRSLTFLIKRTFGVIVLVGFFKRRRHAVMRRIVTSFLPEVLTMLSVVKRRRRELIDFKRNKKENNPEQISQSIFVIDKERSEKKIVQEEYAPIDKQIHPTHLDVPPSLKCCAASVAHLKVHERKGNTENEEPNDKIGCFFFPVQMKKTKIQIHHRRGDVQ